jgi:tRNA(Ile)-lysidine synthase
VGALCAEHGWSLEDGARRVRYAFLADAAARFGASYVATAHTADDQAETVLLRLLRGTGIAGLSGMAPARPLGERVTLVRPLLECWRSSVESYVAARRLPVRDDASNADESLVRNRIRRRLLPLLEQDYNRNIKQHLVQLADQCRWDAAYLHEAAGKQWRRVAQGGEEISFTVKAFRRQPKALQRQLVREAVARTRGLPGQLEFRHWELVEQLFAGAPGSSRLDLPGGVVLEREPHRVRCRPATR